MDFEQPMGDETRAFLEQHFPTAYLGELKAMARSVAGRKAGQVDASGLVIDAVLKAARHRTQLEDTGKLRAWVKTILVREIMAKLQLESCRRRQEFGDDHLRNLPERQAGTNEVEREEEQSWAKAYLHRLLSLLSEGEREVICLSRVQGMPDPEVAALLAISEENLRQRRSRAMKRLQKLAEQFPAR